MRPESRAMGQALLDHHRHRCTREDGAAPPRNECLITYGDLCERAGVPHLTRRPGAFLLEVAVWCEEHGRPYMNALAVNADSMMPGDNYEGAAGCSLPDWPQQVDECIAFRGYPEFVP